jgi:hypothetical protein
MRGAIFGPSVGPTLRQTAELGRGVTVALQTLTLPVLVRIQAPQPHSKLSFYSRSFARLRSYVVGVPIRSFSARHQRRRRCTAVITSTCALVPAKVAPSPSADPRLSLAPSPPFQHLIKAVPSWLLCFHRRERHCALIRMLSLNEIRGSPVPGLTPCTIRGN